ncbi:MAG: hypothetical protein HYV09_36790 [Deltaproteobacteria bacterium]|nr:hypothetical protein [Deltaproteobacteria bacterium]
MTPDQAGATSSRSLEPTAPLELEAPLEPTATGEHWLRKVEFERLPRLVQDRFVASTAETFPPWPILRAHPRAPASRGWSLVAVAAIVALMVLVVTGFGDPSSRFATRPMGFALVFAGLTATALLGFFRALAARGAHDLPFRAGVYLFPSEVIDARSPTLRIHPLAELSSISQDGHHVQVRFRDGDEFSFAVADEATGESAVGQVLRARDALHRAHDAPSLLGLLDPLWEPGEELPVSNGAPFRVRWSFWVERSMAVALAGGLVLGPPAFLLRDWGSDRVAFDRAVNDGSSAALSAYAAHGRRHVRDVQERLLPLVALRGLHGTAAIEQWMAEHPIAASTPEGQAARRGALLRDLAAIVTIPSIRTFAAAHANEGFPSQAEIDAALQRAHRTMVGKRASSLANDHLLTTPAACGSTVSVQIVQGDTNLHQGDYAVSRSPRFGGSTSYPSRYFGSQGGAEFGARSSLEKRIRAAYPEGCLVVVGAAPGTPALQVKWTPRYAGSLLEIPRPPAVFADLAIDVEARLLSGDGRELARLGRSYAATVRQASIARFEKLLLRDPFDPTVERVAYEEVVTRVLGQAAREIGTWFVGYEPDSPVAPL